jgi:hypothetical protein
VTDIKFVIVPSFGNASTRNQATSSKFKILPTLAQIGKVGGMRIGAISRLSAPPRSAILVKQRESNVNALPLQRSRGDKTAIELFIAGIRGWEAELRHYFPGQLD